MKPATFDYLAASSLVEALDALRSTEEARVLAGGQSLVPLMNLRLARPPLLVDVNGLGELDHVTQGDRDVRLGALCRHRRLEHDPDVRAAAPLLAEAAALIGHAQIRNRGTLGGSLAHGDPSAELGAAMLAMDGTLTVAFDGSRREVPAAALWTGFFETTLGPGEMIVEATVPRHETGDGWAFREFAPRRGDFAVCGIAAHIRRSPDGQCSLARIAGCGLGATPVDLSNAGDPVVGQSDLSDTSLREVAARVARDVDPIGDVHATADDRRELAQLLAVGALRAAWGRARDLAR